MGDQAASSSPVAGSRNGEAGSCRAGFKLALVPDNHAFWGGSRLAIIPLAPEVTRQEFGIIILAKSCRFRAHKKINLQHRRKSK
jgi:hypothetical protein